jgi:AcrR family transcriptional regulator
MGEGDRALVDRSEKTQQIVSAAFRVLMQGGVAHLSFDRIANEAGLSRQLVRYYVKDLQSLMVLLCDHLAGAYRSTLIAGVSQLETPNRLAFFLDFYFDLVGDVPKPRDDQAYDAVMAYAAGSRDIRDNLATQYGLLGHVLSHEIEVQYPDMGSHNALELSWLFVSLMYGHWKMVASLGYAEEHNKITRRAMDRLIESYIAQETDDPGGFRPWTRN